MFSQKSLLRGTLPGVELARVSEGEARKKVTAKQPLDLLEPRARSGTGGRLFMALRFLCRTTQNFPDIDREPFAGVEPDRIAFCTNPGGSQGPPQARQTLPKPGSGTLPRQSRVEKLGKSITRVTALRYGKEGQQGEHLLRLEHDRLAAYSDDRIAQKREPETLSSLPQQIVPVHLFELYNESSR